MTIDKCAGSKVTALTTAGNVTGNLLRQTEWRTLATLRVSKYWPVVAAIAGGLILSSCSSGVVRAKPTPRHSATIKSLPSYEEAAARLKPCELVSTKQLSSIIGKPIHIDKVGDIGERPQLSSGVILPKIWSATCNWIAPSHSTTLVPYLMLDLAPDPAGASEEFNGERTMMKIAAPAVRLPGYGQEAIFNVDGHGDVVIIVLQGATVITLELTPADKRAPSPRTGMRMAKVITKIIVKKYGKG